MLVFYERFAQTCLLRGFAAPVNNLTQSPLKEARAGCGLKKRLREFFFIFVYVIFMVFRVYLCGKKIIPHRDCSETGAISKYVSNIAFFV